MWSRRSRIQASAVRAFRLKRYADARAHLETLLEFVGENPNTLHVLGLCAERSGDEEAAAGYARRALAADARHFEALRLASRLAISNARDDDARAFVRRALDVLPAAAPGPGRWLRSLLGGARRSTTPPRPDCAPDLRGWVDWAIDFVDNPVSHATRPPDAPPDRASVGDESAGDSETVRPSRGFQ